MPWLGSKPEALQLLPPLRFPGPRDSEPAARGSPGEGKPAFSHKPVASPFPGRDRADPVSAQGATLTALARLSLSSRLFAPWRVCTQPCRRHCQECSSAWAAVKTSWDGALQGCTYQAHGRDVTEVMLALQELLLQETVLVTPSLRPGQGQDPQP